MWQILSTDLHDLTMILMLSTFQSFSLFAWHKMTCLEHVATCYVIFLRLIDWNQHISALESYMLGQLWGPKVFKVPNWVGNFSVAMSVVQEVAVQDWRILVLWEIHVRSDR